jgi:glycosyltransferase involved in cell wall biosynthesis
MSQKRHSKELRNYSYSIIVPIYNEERNISILSREIEIVLSELKRDYEVLWVDDGSEDRSWEEISKLSSPNRGIRLSRNEGQSAALMAGIDNSKYRAIITLDGDLQNDPADFPSLIERFEKGYDVVTGIRSKRKDNLFLRRIPSYIANSLARLITGSKVTDLGCTLRVFKKSLVDDNRIVGEMHRVLMIFFQNSSARILEVPVNHRPRIHGKSKYGLVRTFKFVADLLLVKWVKLVMKKPLYFFSTLGGYLGLSGLLLITAAVILRLTNHKEYIDGTLVVGGLLILSLSTILFSLGLLAESILRMFLTVDKNLQYNILETK